jgi:copper chaperone CopZ
VEIGCEQTMKITERIEMIEGVEECHYNFDTMSLAIYYTGEHELFTIQIKVADAIDTANIHRAVETQNYYSMEDN